MNEFEEKSKLYKEFKRLESKKFVSNGNQGRYENINLGKEDLWHYNCGEFDQLFGDCPKRNLRMKCFKVQ